MAWLVVLLCWVAGLALGALLYEIVGVYGMRRRRRQREAYDRYIRLIEEESWKGPK